MNDRLQIERDEIHWNFVHITDTECKLLLKIDKWCKNEEEGRQIVESIFENQELKQKIELWQKRLRSKSHLIEYTHEVLDQALQQLLGEQKNVG